MVSLKLVVLAVLVAIAVAKPTRYPWYIKNHHTSSIAAVAKVSTQTDVTIGGGRQYKRPLIGLSFLAKGVSNKCGNSKSIFIKLSEHKHAANFGEATFGVLGVVRALRGVLNVWIPELGTMYSNLVLASFKVHTCIHGSDKKAAVCKNDFGKEWGWEAYGGKCEKTEELIEEYKLKDIVSNLKTLFEKHNKGRSYEHFEVGSHRIVATSIIHVAESLTSFKAENRQLVMASIIKHCITIIGAISNSYHPKLGTHIVSGFIEYIRDATKEAGVEITQNDIVDINTSISICGRNRFNDAVGDCKDEDFNKGYDDKDDDDDDDDDNENVKNGDKEEVKKEKDIKENHSDREITKDDGKDQKGDKGDIKKEKDIKENTGDKKNKKNESKNQKGDKEEVKKEKDIKENHSDREITKDDGKDQKGDKGDIKKEKDIKENTGDKKNKKNESKNQKDDKEKRERENGDRGKEINEKVGQKEQKGNDNKEKDEKKGKDGGDNRINENGKKSHHNQKDKSEEIAKNENNAKIETVVVNDEKGKNGKNENKQVKKGDQLVCTIRDSGDKVKTEQKDKKSRNDDRWSKQSENVDNPSKPDGNKKSSIKKQSVHDVWEKKNDGDNDNDNGGHNGDHNDGHISNDSDSNNGGDNGDDNGDDNDGDNGGHNGGDNGGNNGDDNGSDGEASRKRSSRDKVKENRFSEKKDAFGKNSSHQVKNSYHSHSYSQASSEETRNILKHSQYENYRKNDQESEHTNISNNNKLKNKNGRHDVNKNNQGSNNGDIDNGNSGIERSNISYLDQKEWSSQQSSQSESESRSTRDNLGNEITDYHAESTAEQNALKIEEQANLDSDDNLNIKKSVSTTAAKDSQSTSIKTVHKLA